MWCSDVIKIVEEVYPLVFALEWDNVGLLVGRDDKEVKKILVALDATDDVVNHAVKVGADMLITHHPLIFGAIKRVNNQDFIGARILKLVKSDISYYAMHTNYDVLGMADIAGGLMELSESEILEVTWEKEPQKGIGKIGYLETEMSLRECCELVKQKFSLKSVKVFGDLDQRVRRAAVSPGSGKSVIKTALLKQADVLITGDIDHHEGIDAVDQDLMIIDAGHYGLEHIFIQDMKDYLESRIKDIIVETEPVSHPFHII